MVESGSYHFSAAWQRDTASFLHAVKRRGSSLRKVYVLVGKCAGGRGEGRGGEGLGYRERTGKRCGSFETPGVNSNIKVTVRLARVIAAATESWYPLTVC